MNIPAVIVVIWQITSVISFLKLTFQDGIYYTWWNWIIIIPVNIVVSELWFIYWPVRLWFGFDS